MRQINILDCTLRDGGYYNNWDFSKELVIDYLKSIQKSGVTFLELGFRNLPKNKFLGCCGYTTDNFINSLKINDDTKVIVMLNAKDILDNKESDEYLVKKLFKAKSESRVDLVRIAVNYKNALRCKKIIETLNGLGYETALNLMQIALASDEDIEFISAGVNNWNLIKVIYFADTLGNMSHNDIDRIIKALNTNWEGEIGFHSHNNTGQALSNTLYAVKKGIKWVDSTITGMGRGAGNVETEYLLLEAKKENIGDYNPENLINILNKHFYSLKEIYKWGSNFYYYLAAINKIHPTYIQEMLSTDRYNSEDIVNVINILSDENVKNSFSQKNINFAINKNYTSELGEWNAVNRFENKTVLLLAHAPKAKEHKDGIIEFIKSACPTVLSLNHSDTVPDEYVDIYMSCHPTRIMAFAHKEIFYDKPLVLPRNALSKDLLEKFANKKVLDYGLKVEENVIKISSQGCTLPSALVAPYALSIAIAGNARKILLAGFDGYLPNDPRYFEMVEIFEGIQKQTDIEISAITPTLYPINQKSVYMESL